MITPQKTKQYLFFYAALVLLCVVAAYFSFFINTKKPHLFLLPASAILGYFFSSLFCNALYILLKQRNSTRNARFSLIKNLSSRKLSILTKSLLIIIVISSAYTTKYLLLNSTTGKCEAHVLCMPYISKLGRVYYNDDWYCDKRLSYRIPNGPLIMRPITFSKYKAGATLQIEYSTRWPEIYRVIEVVE